MAHTSTDSERGSILVLTALVLVALLGMTALAVDAGFLFDVRQKMQSAADAAARSGALEAARGIADTCTGTGACGLRPFVEHEALVHGFTHGQGGVTVTINRPPTQSANGFNTNNNYVEVIISRSTSTFFMRLFN